MTIKFQTQRLCGLLAAACLTLAPGCGGSDDADAGGEGPEPMGGGDDSDSAGPGETPVGPGVGQGGAQDFGQFRAILEAGDIPGPETLDDVGFFNEHKVEMPAPECGDDVCIHGMLGVMGNMLSGANCTLVLLGMNTPIDPTEIERPPLNLAIAVDTSGSMAGAPIEHVREGLRRMSDVLRTEDRVSLVTFDDGAAVLAEAVAGDSADLQVAISELSTGGSTNMYEGLRTAYEVVADHAVLGQQNRVMLLSDGQATTGLLNDDKLTNLSTAYAIEGLGLSTVGLGLDFDPTLMRTLAETGGGAFYFLESHAAVEEVFEQEAQALLLPLASEVSIDLDVSSGYQLRGLYGTKLADVGLHTAHMEIPSLHIAHRESTGDNEGGRRGGGGAIVAELIPTEGAQPDGDRVGTISMRYRVPGAEDLVMQSAEILSPLEPGETPTEGWFDTEGAEKAFVTLNLYIGFLLASERAAVGDDGGALNLLVALEASVDGWLQTNDDEDIIDDQRYVVMFIDNLMARGAAIPPPSKPPEPWPAD
ncbi:MAG: VWA domain-containing protein [Deltaproteobacteria bacterium]|nr:VWA domain-containing protein [Deltaproteobacteria bacterium]